MTITPLPSLNTKLRSRAMRKGRASQVLCTLLLGLLVAPLTAGAINNDSLPDFVFANQSQQTSRVCLQNGLLGAVCSDVTPDFMEPAAVALGDVDKDGNLDAVFANAVFQRNRLCFGNGRGNLNDCIDVSADANFSLGLALGDLNADQYIDALFANEGVNRLCLGDGRGSLNDCSDVSADTNRSNAVALGDVNNDGTLDAVFANTDFEANRVCLGDGGGGFVCSDASPDELISRDLALGDMNEDGNLDLVVANGGVSNVGEQEKNQVCLGDGLGGFLCSSVSPDENLTIAVALGDLDGDRDLDAVFANFGVNRVCLGDGSGSLDNCSDVSPDDNFHTSVVLSDINGDETLDASFSSPGQNRLCFGNGIGGFESCRDIGPDSNITAALAVSRDGLFCSSPARTVLDLRLEVGTLRTSLHKKDQLNSRLDHIDAALDDEAFDKARERVHGFMFEANRSANASSTPDQDEITLAEANSLICGAGNLIRTIPEEAPALRGRVSR